jgi:hypothetical protein
MAEREMLQIGHPCGLCNRVDVIATGYVLAQQRGEENVELFWPLNSHLPIRFHDLFTGLPSGRVVEREIDHAVIDDYYAAQAALPVDYRGSAPYGHALRRLLNHVVPEVLAEVSEFASRQFGDDQRGRRPVGVHVRRSEHPMPLCPYAQPLRYYEAVMKSLPKETRFFVSTDSQDSFRWLDERFAERVFQRLKRHDNRVDLSGVREGLVDMLLLSRCSAIIGTHGSSFSGTAALAGGSVILMVKTFPHVPPQWPGFSTWRWLWAYRHFLVESTFWKRWFAWSLRPAMARLFRVPARCWRISRSCGSTIASACSAITARGR